MSRNRFHKNALPLIRPALQTGDNRVAAAARIALGDAKQWKSGQQRSNFHHVMPALVAGTHAETSHHLAVKASITKRSTIHAHGVDGRD
jgi:hypothetical protein